MKIIETNYIEGHTNFLKKHPNPLWKNNEFFKTLSFKQNEDINPIKASHKGIKLEHLALAKVELKQLQLDRLIESTKSEWACEAFYVNKRAKQAKGKLRLAINYKPSNHFLVDDKFPLFT